MRDRGLKKIDSTLSPRYPTKRADCADTAGVNVTLCHGSKGRGTNNEGNGAKKEVCTFGYLIID